MKLIDADYLKINGKYADMIKYKDNIVWRRFNPKFDGPGVILRYTASNNTTEPSLNPLGLTHNTVITGSGPYCYEITVDDINLLYKISFNKKESLLTVDYVNVSNITNMKNMFYYCTSLVSLNLSNFNTSNVTDMSGMFGVCTSLTSLSVSNFNTSKVVDMNSMFMNCPLLTELDLSNFDTSNVTNMSDMFDRCKSLISLDLSHWNTSNVTDVTYMFSDCTKLESLDISNFTLANCSEENIKYMFDNCSSLHTLRLDNCNNYTIYYIINSVGFPTNKIDGVTRTIYCKEENASGWQPPTNWVFSFID